MTCRLQQYTPDWMDGSMEAKNGGEWCRWDEADAEIDRLRFVVQKVVDWNTKYPSSRIYSEYKIREIAAEMDIIFEQAKDALS